MPTATHRLRIRRLDTIGFVDKGDDPKAEIVFLKRIHEDDLHKRIIARGNKFIVMSDDGSKILGTHDTREGAERQLAAVEANTNKERPVMDRMTKFLRAIGLRVGMPEDDIEKLLADGASGSDDDKGSDKGGDMPFDIEKLGDEERVEFEKLQGQLATATAKVEELEKDADGGDDELNTDDLPKPVAKALLDFEKRTKAAEDRAEAAEESVSKLVDEREREKYIRLAKTIGLVPDDDAETLRKIAGALEPEDFEKFTAKITAMAKQAVEGGLYGEIGKTGEINGDEAEGEVVELAKAYRDANPGTSEELARGQVFKSRPDLRRAVDARSNNNAEG